MKRLLLVLLALVPGLVLLAWLGAQGEGVAARWQRLPSGGEVRVRGITFGMEHEMENDDRSLQQRVRDWLKGPRPKGGPSPFALRKRSFRGGHCLHVWVEFKGVPVRTPRFERAILCLPEGESFESTGARMWTGAGGGELVAIRFPLVPYRAPEVRLTIDVGKEQLAFNLQNPATRQRLPAWTPQPLPLTIKAGDVELTLRSLRVIDPGTGRLDPWLTQPDWRIRDDGRDALQWYSIEPTYTDPGGNMSATCVLPAEPVWRVHAAVRSTRHYPHPVGEVHWLGAIDPAATGLGAALPLDGYTKTRGIHFAGVLESGEYHFDGKGLVQGASKSASPAWDPRLSGPYTPPIGMPVTLVARSLVVVADRPMPNLLWRAADDTVHPAEFEPQERLSYGVTLLTLPDIPMQLGVAEERKFTFDFYVAAPERPKVAPSPAPR